MRRLLMAACLAIAGTGGVGLGLGSSTHVVFAGKPTSTTLGLAYIDPTADQRGPVDVTGMSISWDSHQNYTIALTADNGHPFTGQFRVTVNLYDPSAPTTYDNGAKSFEDFFSLSCKNCATFNPKSNANDFDLGTGIATSLTISGKNSILQFWSAGDQVATSTYAGLGNPPGASLFRSSVDGLPFTFLTNEDMIGVDDATCDPYATSTPACPSPQSDSSATIVTM
jgi:hypothetical protein